MTVDTTKAPRPRPRRWRLFEPIVALVLLVGCGAGAATTATPTPPPELPKARPDGALGHFRGVLVQRTTSFATSFSNDAVPDFDLQRYDTDGAWSPEVPDRIVIPAGWDGAPVVFTVRAAWSGHDDDYVELKLYCGAERPIEDAQEERLVAVVQMPPNLASPFVELTTPPLLLDPGTECMIAFKTPAERTLIPYGRATTLFGAYVP